MTQDYQMIGQAAPELQAVAEQHQGWGDTPSQPTVHDTAEPMTTEITDSSDYSFWDRRANTQMQSGNMASHNETPMAAVAGTPPQAQVFTAAEAAKKGRPLI